MKNLKEYIDRYSWGVPKMVNASKFNEAFERIEAMYQNNDDDWDLSPNDEIALGRMIAWVTILRKNAKIESQNADKEIEREYD